MKTVNYTRDQYLSESIFTSLRRAKEGVLKGQSLYMNPVEDGFEFHWSRFENSPLRHVILGNMILNHLGISDLKIPESTLFFDIETHGIEKRWDMPPEEYFRMGQYAWGEGEVIITTDYREMMEQIDKAQMIVGHNIHSFDLSVLYGTKSLTPLRLAQQRKVFDTLVAATLLTPAPYEFTMANKRYVKDANHPGNAMLWYGLDNLCYQHGIEGKFGDIRELAKKHNPPKTLVRDLDYGLIPTDDPDFREYGRQDVVSLRDFYKLLCRVQGDIKYPNEYFWREQELHAVLAQISRNGIRPDVELASKKVTLQEEVVSGTMDYLVREFGFPSVGLAPWKSNAGKAAILKALAAYGITPEHEDWERTAKGAPSFSGDTMIAVTRGTEAEELGQALAQLQGLRSMPSLILSSVRGDGRMHPDYTAFQKSGRFSVYNPSVLIFNQEHKDMLLADEGCYTVELDFSNADARAVAAMSGDVEFARRFETNPDGTAKYDGHNLSGEVFFGYDLYHSDCLPGECKKGCKPPLRPAAKAATLALGYNVGPGKLAALLNKAAKDEGIDIEFWCSTQTYWAYKKATEMLGEKPLQESAWLISIRQEGKIHTRELVRNYHQEYHKVKQWKDRVVFEGDSYGHVTNDWGRRMNIDFAGESWDAPEGRRSRSYNQSPALLGQSTTRELMSDFVLRMGRKGEKWVRALRGIIHDAVVVDLPQGSIKEDVKVVQSLMQGTFSPQGRESIPIEFPAGIGPLNAMNWKDGSH